MRAHHDGSHSPICLPLEAEHSSGWVRAWQCWRHWAGAGDARGEEISGLQFVPWRAEGRCVCTQLCIKPGVRARNLCPPRASQCQRPWHAAQASRPWVQDQGESRFKAKGYGREGSNHKANTTAFSNRTHGSDTINRRKGTKISPRVAAWTQARKQGCASGWGVFSGVTAKGMSCSAAAARQYPGAGMMSGLQGRYPSPCKSHSTPHLSPCKTRCIPRPGRALALPLRANPVPSPQDPAELHRNSGRGKAQM